HPRGLARGHGDARGTPVPGRSDRMSRTARQRRAANPRTLTLASGKGGVGRSTVAAELARALSRNDKTVLLVEVGDSQTIATMLDLAPVEKAAVFEPGADWGAEVRDTGIANVGLLSLDLTRPVHAAGTPAWSIHQLHEALRRLGRDWTVVDLPGDTSPAVA